MLRVLPAAQVIWKTPAEVAQWQPNLMFPIWVKPGTDAIPIRRDHNPNRRDYSTIAVPDENLGHLRMLRSRVIFGRNGAASHSLRGQQSHFHAMA
jgi:hypothetical protein